jgi:hypothetical protein
MAAYLYTYGNGKQKNRYRYAILLNLSTVCPFVHFANRSLSFIRLLMKKKNGICLFANGVNGFTNLPISVRYVGRGH